MARGFLTLPTNDKKQITFWTVFKADILPWLLTAGFALFLFMCAVWVVGSNRPDLDNVDKAANLYTWARPLYFVLVALACFLATRSKGVWTWVLAAILIIFFVQFVPNGLASVALPNSILPAMVAMIGFLAFGRLVEYIRMRYGVGLKEPRLSVSAIVAYSLLICGAIVFDSAIVFALFWR